MSHNILCSAFTGTDYSDYETDADDEPFSPRAHVPVPTSMPDHNKAIAAIPEGVEDVPGSAHASRPTTAKTAHAAHNGSAVHHDHVEQHGHGEVAAAVAVEAADGDR